jgi:hypothetical protein
LGVDGAAAAFVVSLRTGPTAARNSSASSSFDVAGGLRFIIVMLASPVRANAIVASA